MLVLLYLSASIYWVLISDRPLIHLILFLILIVILIPIPTLILILIVIVIVIVVLILIVILILIPIVDYAKAYSWWPPLALYGAEGQ